MMERILCNKQYVGKAETSFNVRAEKSSERCEKSRRNNGLQKFLTGKRHFQQTCKIYRH